MIHACYIISRRTLHHPSAYADLEACPHGDMTQPHGHGYKWLRVPVWYIAAPYPRPCACHPVAQPACADHSVHMRNGGCSVHTPFAAEALEAPRTDGPLSPPRNQAGLPLPHDMIDLYEDNGPTAKSQVPAYEPPTAMGREEMKKLKEELKADKKSF